MEHNSNLIVSPLNFSQENFPSFKIKDEIYLYFLDLQQKLLTKRLALNLKIANEKINFVYKQSSLILEETSFLEEIAKPDLNPELVSLKVALGGK